MEEPSEQDLEIDEDPEKDEVADPDETPDSDEAIDDAAQGVSGTSDETADGTGEIDAMGDAAGLAVDDERPFRGIDEVEDRDERRWELDPGSENDDPPAS